MEGFNKIELASGKDSDDANNPRRKIKFRMNRKVIKIILPIIVILFVLSIISYFTVFLPAKNVYAQGIKAYQQAQKIWDAIKNQDIEEASAAISATKKELAKSQKSLASFSYVRFIPFANLYYNDADHLLKAGVHGLDSATILVDSLEPYADVLGLKGEGGSFVMGTAEERIQTAVLTMGKITPKIDDIAGSLTKARKEIDEVDPNHYYSFLGLSDVKNQLGRLRTLADEGIILVEQARPFIKTLPSLLGDPEQKRYLVIFQNDKELRPTGGFITAYSIFRIDKGVVHVDRSGDIYDLDNHIVGKEKAPDPILNYLGKVYELNLRDSNLSPDFVESMKTFESLYEKVPGRIEVDGIIALDTHVLVSTIKILDDEVFASGIRFTSKTDDRCDCPQVIYELEDQISRPVGFEREGRKQLLGSLLYAIMEKALKSSPGMYWGPLFQDMFTKISEKHVLLYLYAKEAQDGVEALNAAGRIRPFEGDYLHINQANFGGAKSNLFVKESVTQDYKVEGDGAIVKNVTVSYVNPYAPSDCNLERGGLCLNATLRDWIRIYVPEGSKLIEFKGSEVKMSSYEELGKTVFEGFLTVRPKGSATFTISYRLPFKVAGGSPLPLLIQKQPGTHDNEYTVKVGGKEIEKFPLLTDKEIKIKL